MTAIEAIAENGILDRNDVRIVLNQVLKNMDISDKKVLFIIPDNAQKCPLNLMFTEMYRAFKPKVAWMDVLLARGAHAPLSEDEIFSYLEFDKKEFKREFKNVTIYNHLSNESSHLTELGTIPGEKMEELSRGMLDEPIKVTINKMIFIYDLLVVIGPTFPHEVAGFSGGINYLVPGIAGQEIINGFHWLGALSTNREIKGTLNTPGRELADYCASMIKIFKYSFNLVVSAQGLHGIFAGTPEEAFKPAAELSSKLHIRKCPRSYHTVLLTCPTMDSELWTAAQYVYQLESVVEKGGRLIMYAPHMSEISKTYGGYIKDVGYHCLPYFTAQREKFQHVPGEVLAHSTRLKGNGAYENGVEIPDINVVIASKIPEEMCKLINLGYLAPDNIKVEEYENRENEGVLVVPNAGETMHLLKPARV